jgi:hypothetical protein
VIKRQKRLNDKQISTKHFIEILSNTNYVKIWGKLR